MIHFAYVYGVGWRLIIAPSVNIWIFHFSYVWIIPVHFAVPVLVFGLAAAVVFSTGSRPSFEFLPRRDQVQNAGQAVGAALSKGLTLAVNVITAPFRAIASFGQWMMGNGNVSSDTTNRQSSVGDGECEIGIRPIEPAADISKLMPKFNSDELTKMSENTKLNLEAINTSAPAGAIHVVHTDQNPFLDLQQTALPQYGNFVNNHDFSTVSMLIGSTSQQINRLLNRA